MPHTAKGAMMPFQLASTAIMAPHRNTHRKRHVVQLCGPLGHPGAADHVCGLCDGLIREDTLQAPITLPCQLLRCPGRCARRAA